MSIIKKLYAFTDFFINASVIYFLVSSKILDNIHHVFEFRALQNSKFLKYLWSLAFNYIQFRCSFKPQIPRHVASHFNQI